MFHLGLILPVSPLSLSVILTPGVPLWSSSVWRKVLSRCTGASLSAVLSVLGGKDTQLKKGWAMLRAGSSVLFVFLKICQWKCTVFQSILYFHLIRFQMMHWEDKKANLPCTHLWVLSPASRRLHGVRSLDNLLRRGGGLVRGVIWTLLHHVLTLLALWCGRARAFTQDWWAGGRALVWVTGSAKKNQRNKQKKKREKEENSFQWDLLSQQILRQTALHDSADLQVSVDSSTARTLFAQPYITWGLIGLKHHVLTWLIMAKLIRELKNKQQQQKQQWRNEMA